MFARVPSTWVRTAGRLKLAGSLFLSMNYHSPPPVSLACSWTTYMSVLHPKTKYFKGQEDRAFQKTGSGSCKFLMA